METNTINNIVLNINTDLQCMVDEEFVKGFLADKPMELGLIPLDVLSGYLTIGDEKFGVRIFTNHDNTKNFIKRIPADWKEKEKLAMDKYLEDFNKNGN